MSKGSNPRWLIVSLGLAMILLASACGDETSASTDALSVDEVWARSTAPGADVAAFYATVRNASEADDVLVGASSDRCSMAEIHLSTMEDGVMSMAPASEDDRTVAIGQSLVLEPGGLHVMCMGLTEQLVEGETIGLELDFQTAGAVDLAVTVRQP